MCKKELSILKSIFVFIKIFVYLVVFIRVGFYVCRMVISNDDLLDCFLYFIFWVFFVDVY